MSITEPLSFNEIDFIHPEAFKNCCENLRTLKLQNNKIIDLKINLNVKNLDLSNNRLENLQDNDLFHAENLEELDLSNNYLGPLNISLFSKLTNLEVLNLRGTNISNIQFGTFSHQHALRVLIISDNSLGQLDLHWFAALDKLEVFYMSGNRLKKIENLSQIKTIFPDLKKISHEKSFVSVFWIEMIRILMEPTLSYKSDGCKLFFCESTSFCCIFLILRLQMKILDYAISLDFMRHFLQRGHLHV